MGLGGIGIVQNLRARSANISSYRGVHSENFYFSIFLGPKWATAATTTATTAEEFCQAIQAPSPTHPWTTYPVRVSPHSDHRAPIQCRG